MKNLILIALLLVGSSAVNADPSGSGAGTNPLRFEDVKPAELTDGPGGTSGGSNPSHG